MPANSYTRLLTTIRNLIQEAAHKGLDVDNPIRMTLLGSTIQGDMECPTRDVTVAFSMPEITPAVELWCNPVTRSMYVCDPISRTWFKISEYTDMFTNAANSAYFLPDVGGGGGSPVDSSGAITQPLQTTNDLIDTPTDQLQDATLVFIEATKTIYAYDRQSTDNSVGTIIPSDGVGRWIPVSTPSVLNLDGGTF